MNKKNTLLNSVIWGVGTAMLCVALLFTTALISREAVKTKCEESAEYFTQQSLFPIYGSEFFTFGDNYSDCILLDILYHVDKQELVPSVIRSSYYHRDGEAVSFSFQDAIRNEVEPNQEYARYWHGQNVVLRPLLLFLNIRQIRILLGVLTFSILLLTCVFLWHYEEKLAVVSLLLSLLFVHSFMIVVSIEYVTSYLVMAIALLVILIKKHVKNTKAFFLVIGIVTCFTDFLTTETLTFTMPLAILLIIECHEERIRDVRNSITFCIQNGIAWIFGYAGMFALKWTLIYAVLGKEVFFSALMHAGERMLGEAPINNNYANGIVSVGGMYFGALWHNIGCLFPFTGSVTAEKAFGMLIAVITICVLLIYFFSVDGFDGRKYIPILLLGTLPYMRYLVLPNHSYIHFYMTYRAQMITIFGLVFITLSMMENATKKIKI